MELKTEANRLKGLLSSNKRELDQIALDFLPLRHNSPEISSLYEMMRDYPSRGGKGLRGTLCLLWCQLFGGKREHALISAAAMELFQNWILIHDDIEDSSDLRRGLPALHKKYGVELAINAGDALHGKMWELLIRNEKLVGPKLSLEIFSEFCTMLNETTEGQQMELAWTLGGEWDISEKDYLLMVTKKAAWYTCISPARIGIILSRANASNNVLRERTETSDAELFERVVSFGTNLGIAFQIIDDVLNLTADESKYGKEILGDIYEGKRTLMLIHLLGSVDRKEKKKIIEVLGKKRQEKSREEVELIFRRMKDWRSIDYARKVAKMHSERALKGFDEIIATVATARHTEEYEVTRALLEYMTSRDY